MVGLAPATGRLALVVLRMPVTIYRNRAAWGPDSDWVRNRRAGPAVIAQVGTTTFTPEHRFLTPRESYEIAVAFRREHPARLRLFSALLGWGNLWDDAALQSFVTTHPLIALRPAPTRRADNPIS
jgi:hypothetical protein